jgi:hypothetical protein
MVQMFVYRSLLSCLESGKTGGRAENRTVLIEDVQRRLLYTIGNADGLQYCI